MKLRQFLLLFLAVAPLTSVAEPPSLRLSGEKWSPYMDEDPQPRFACDIVELALARIGIMSKVDLMTPGSEYAPVRSGRFDGVVAVWKTPQREAYMHYSEPYLENRLVLVARHGQLKEPENLSELKGKKIGIVGVYGYLDQLSHVKGPEFVTGKDDQDLIMLLLQGSVDYILIDELVIHHTMEFYGTRAEGLLSIGEVPYLKEPLHLAIHVEHPHAETIIDNFNAQIGEMLKDGSYNDILRMNWIRADIDDDGNHEIVLAGPQTGPRVSGDAYRVRHSHVAQIGHTRIYVVAEGRYYEDWDDVPARHREAYDVDYPDSWRGVGVMDLGQ